MKILLITLASLWFISGIIRNIQEAIYAKRKLKKENELLDIKIDKERSFKITNVKNIKYVERI